MRGGRTWTTQTFLPSAGRYVRLMWKEYRNKVRPFVLDVAREGEAAVKKEGAWKYGQEEEEEERKEEDEVIFAEQEEPREEEKDKEVQEKRE